ncbi:MAG: 4-oxalocrotonate tautomerase [Alphaproteobacteria bacterium]|nr:4-oxalocrotonate tautomerase [Alphaproteobacteria bacterium]
MPIVDISILEGRTDDKKAELIREVTDTVCRVLDSEPARVRVLIRDVPHANWGVAGTPKSQSD